MHVSAELDNAISVVEEMLKNFDEVSVLYDMKRTNLTNKLKWLQLRNDLGRRLLRTFYFCQESIKLKLVLDSTYS